MKSKLLVLALLLATGVSAFAGERQIMTCTEQTDTGIFFEVIQDGVANGKATGYLSITDGGDSPARVYHSLSGFADLVAGTSATVILQTKAGTANDASFVNNGINSFHSSASMLRVLEGQRTAYLAVEGSVYQVKCRR